MNRFSSFSRSRTSAPGRRGVLAGLAALTLLPSVSALSAAEGELRVIVHGSFSLPKELLAKFEADSGIKLAIVKGGDAGEMLNKLILTKAQPIADVVFGIDNTLALKAERAGVLAPYDGPAARRAGAAALPGGLVAVDHGYVSLNHDRAWFAKAGLALPKSLEDLAQPAYKDLVVVQNPATSSAGNAFLLATIGGLGEEGAFAWWGRMRANGLKVVKGWSEAYNTEFTRNGGTRPIVVSYASSPAAEVFYAKDKPAESPTASLSLKGGVFHQVEGVALLRGGTQPVAAARFIEFLRSPAVQEALQTRMWMEPVETGVARAEVLQRHAPLPTLSDGPAPADIADKGADWVQRWQRVVLR